MWITFKEACEMAKKQIEERKLKERQSPNYDYYHSKEYYQSDEYYEAEREHYMDVMWDAAADGQYWDSPYDGDAYIAKNSWTSRDDYRNW